MIVNKINLSSSLEKADIPKIKFTERVRKRLKGFFAPSDLTFEDWERIERKYSPHSSHHGQIYFRDRGL